MHALGPRSVTVPGAVRAWADLAERYGRLGLDAALADAIDAAERGVAATERVAESWAATDRAPRPAPRLGEVYRLPELARTLRSIAREGPAGFYEGRVAEAIAGSSWLAVEDLAAHRSEWVVPLRAALPRRRGVRAAAERAGRGGVDRARAAEGLPDTPALADRGDEARARRRLRVGGRRAAAASSCSTRSTWPRRRALVSPERALDPQPSHAAARRHDVSVRRRR